MKSLCAVHVAILALELFIQIVNLTGTDEAGVKRLAKLMTVERRETYLGQSQIYFF